MNYFTFVSSAALAAAALSFPASAVDLQAPGLPNFYQVNEHVYRGGQPADEAWNHLAKLGIKTVIDLRRPTEHSTTNEQRLVQAAGMRYVNVPMNGVVSPTQEQVSKVLALMNSSEAGPVFIHCKRGADRTGTILAAYRMGHDGWDNKKAFKEAKSLGMSWMQFGMKHYILNYHAGTEVAGGTTQAPAAAAAPAAAGATRQAVPVAP